MDLDPLWVEVPSPRLGTPYDPAPKREKTRTVLAYGFAATLALLVLVPLAAIVFSDNSWSDFEQPMQTLLPAVLGITGTILGFYFGSEKGK
jgi:hypothetical protein